MQMPSDSRTDLLLSALQPIENERSTGSTNSLLDFADKADFVLLGEASHGTHEFYAMRAAITQQLISEKGFQAVAAEADWPDSYRVNQYIRGRGNDRTAFEALSGYTRFPVWMWRNCDVEAFVEWLRQYNKGRQQGAPEAGFYGLDLYSLYRSRDAVLRYLEKVDPDAARRARYRYSCFDHFGEDEQAYGYATVFGVSESCQREVIEQLKELELRAYEYRHRDGQIAEVDFFSAEQNARVIMNAEEYYRAMFQGRVNTWNLRDRHMADTLFALAAHLEHRYGRARIVVWANSHLGDDRATERARYHEWNFGQLVRESNAKSLLVGFTTYTVTVTAANDWGAPHEPKRVRAALPETYEWLFHTTQVPNFLVTFAGNDRLVNEFRSERLERAIGVIYRPETERLSHYFFARMNDQFDAVLHFDESTAVEPLPHAEEDQTAEVPETYPAGV
jgi:erythromycin esterase-like protein